MRRKLLLIPILLITAVLVGPPATAQTSATWNCRASAAYLVLPTNPIITDRIEPVVANGSITAAAPDKPQCVDDQSGVPQVVLSGPPGSIELNAPNARTSNVEETSPVREQKITSDANVASARVLGGTTEAVSARVLQAHAEASCVNGVPTLVGSSTVDELKIGGNVIPIPFGSEPRTIPAGPVTVHLNEEIKTADMLVRRALRVVLPGGFEAIVAEAKVSNAAGVCDNALPSTNNNNTGGGGNNGGNQVAGTNQQSGRLCPEGSRYDAPTERCVIDRPDGTVIVVGRVGDVPVGGRVMALDEARERFGSGRCLKGRSPAFVILGTRGNDNITGTNRKDRILLLKGKDRAEGGRGNDCIFGAGGSDTMSGALGVDRLFGGSGKDHLVGGSHRDFLIAGKGNDSINSGYGKDKVRGGAGRDVINTATAGPAARVSCGRGLDKFRGNSNERRRARGCEISYFIR